MYKTIKLGYLKGKTNEFKLLSSFNIYIWGFNRIFVLND